MSRSLFIVGYLVTIAIALGVERAARKRRVSGPEGRAGLPTFDNVLAYIQQARTGRAVIFIGWWWLGFHFLAR